jgi:hypothetical protein
MLGEQKVIERMMPQKYGGGHRPKKASAVNDSQNKAKASLNSLMN